MSLPAAASGLANRFLLPWAEGYGWGDLRSDAVAGLTVGFMLVPQGMAYAVLAGVPPIYGLYASAIPLLVYPLFGTVRHLAAGMNAVSMVVVAAGVSALADPGSEAYVGLVIALTATVGLCELAMASLRLGFLADLLSRPVITGFTAAAAVIIVVSQLGSLLGIEVGRHPHVWQSLWEVLERAEEAHVPSLLLGSAGVGFLVLADRLAPRLPGELLFLVAATVAAAVFGLPAVGVEVVGRVPSGLPPLSLPPVGVETVAELWPTAVTLALVHFMGVVSIGEVFAARHGYTVDPNRELLAVGMGNVTGSFFQAVPASGSFSRTAVNARAGARSPASNVAAATLILLVLLFLTPLFGLLPMPALAAIVVVAGAGLIDVDELRRLFQAKRSEGWVALLTAAATLGIGIEEGIFVGVAAAAITVLYRLSRPHVSELGLLPGTRSFRNVQNFPAARRVRNLLILRVDAGLTFFNAKYLRELLLERVREEGRRVRYVVIDGTSVNLLDTTAVQALRQTVEDLEERGIEFHMAGLTAAVRDVVRASGLGAWLGEERFHLNVHEAVDRLLSREEGPESARRRRYHEVTEEDHPVGLGPTEGEELT